MRVIVIRILFFLIGAICHLGISSASNIDKTNASSFMGEKVHIGQLSNGLRYYLANTSGERIEFRLALRVGSYQEEKKGVAHYIEHLAFGGTRHFPNKSIIRYWESLGMRYGRDINAFTGHDRTVYTLSHPRTSLTKLDTTLWALSEFIYALSFDKSVVERERQIILAEQKGYVQEDNFYPLKIGIGRDNQLPIGTAADVNTITIQHLREYYQQWYRPQHVRLVITGPININEIEQIIRNRFSVIPPRKSYKNLPPATLHYKPGVSIQTIADSLMENNQWEVIIPHRIIAQQTLTDWADRQLAEAIVRCLNHRFSYRQSKISVENAWYLYDVEQMAFSFQGNGTDVLEKYVSAIAAELNNIKQEGLTQQEWEWIKKEFSEKQNASVENDAASLADEWIVDTMIDDSIEAQWSQSDFHKAIHRLDKNRAKEIVAEWLHAAEEHLLIAVKANGNKHNQPNEKRIMELWKEGLRTSLTTPTCRNQEDKEELPIPIPDFIKKNQATDSSYLSQTEYHNLGITTARLKNGMQLIAKPTLNDQFSAILIGQGGLSGLKGKRYYQLENTAAYMEMGGVERLPLEKYQQWMSQENMMLNIGINNHIHQIMGLAPAKHYHTLLTMMRQRIMTPELLYKDFEEAKKEEIANFGKETMLNKLLKRDSERKVAYLTDSIMGNIFFMNEFPKSVDDIKAQNLDSMAVWYKQLFSHSPSALIVLGQLPPFKTLIAEANAAFGNFQCDTIPQITQQELWHVSDSTLIVKDNRQNKVIHFLYGITYAPSLHTELTIKLLRDVIQNRLIEYLREKRGLTYSPYVITQQSGLPFQRSLIEVVCETDLDKEDLLVNEWDCIVKNLKEIPISKEELRTLKNSFLTTKSQVLHESALPQWRDLITRLLTDGISLGEYERYEETLNSITAEDLQEAFRQYLNHKTTIILEP